MNHLLRVSVSQRQQDSWSLRILDEFTTRFREVHPDMEILDRETQRIPHLDFPALTAGRTQIEDHTPELAKAFELASDLTDEVLEASALVIATPMYNWGPPSSLKAWIDRIINIKTFYRESPALAGLPITFIVASGGRYTTEDMAPHDHLRPWLIECFTRIGASAEDLTFIDCDPTGPLDRGIADHLDEDSGWTRALAQADEAALRSRTLPAA
jgi:FMN-dependent NADH-azoreductase